MSLKKVLYEKHGLLIKDSESEYFDYLLESNDAKYDYNNALTSFIKGCDTRYFGKDKIKSLTKALVLLEMSRSKHTPMGKGTAPDGKGDAGNITAAQLLGDNGIDIEEATDTMNGKGIAYIRDDNGNSKNIPMEPDELHVFTQTIKTTAIAKS